MSHSHKSLHVNCKLQINTVFLIQYHRRKSCYTKWKTVVLYSVKCRSRNKQLPCVTGGMSSNNDPHELSISINELNKNALQKHKNFQRLNVKFTNLTFWINIWHLNVSWWTRPVLPDWAGCPRSHQTDNWRPSKPHFSLLQLIFPIPVTKSFETFVCVQCVNLSCLMWHSL